MINNRLRYKILEISQELKFTNPHRCKHFSFVVKRNTILSFGQNTYDKTHPVGKSLGYRNCAIHSELAAIVNFQWPHSELNECDMVNIRLNRHGIIRYARPCSGCLQLLDNLNIRRVYYTNREGIFNEIRISGSER